MLIIGLAFLGIGLVLVGIAPSVGASLAYSYLSFEGGVDTAVFASIADSYISSVRTIGSVIALLGGLKALLAAFFLPEDECLQTESLLSRGSIWPGMQAKIMVVKLE